MADKKSTNKNVRKLTKLGQKSIAVTIPIEIVRELGWKEKQKVVVKKIGKKLIISDWKK
jgi:bifunctional DNA-binding transcriptional regulator/antitoxin component of YhaV-PrlF toxin-antitoxin module